MKFILSIWTVLIILIVPTSAFAHAVVKPAIVGIGSYTDFTVGVPSEKEAATTMVKLFIPEGINSVSPIVKPGWKVEVINSDKTGEPDDDGNTNPIPAAIVWTGGSIPGHQKDFFMFSTQVPAKETELDWKIEQTYGDGSVMSWNLSSSEQPKDEKGNPDYSKSGPYSVTKVMNDLTSSPKPETQVNEESRNLPLMLSAIAVLISGFALGITLRKR